MGRRRDAGRTGVSFYNAKPFEKPFSARRAGSDGRRPSTLALGRNRWPKETNGRKVRPDPVSIHCWHSRTRPCQRSRGGLRHRSHNGKSRPASFIRIRRSYYIQLHHRDHYYAGHLRSAPVTTRSRRARRNENTRSLTLYAPRRMRELF